MEAARHHADAAVDVASRQESVLVLGVATYVQAMVEFRSGDRPKAVAKLERALTRVESSSTMWRTIISGWLGYALSGIPGRDADALRHSEFAVGTLREHGGWEEEATIRLGLVYSLERCDRERAAVELSNALSALDATARRIDEPYYRWTLVRHCTGHAELIDHARARGVAIPEALQTNDAPPQRPNDFYARCLRDDLLT